MVGAIELKTMQAQLRHPQKRMTKPRILREIVAVQVKKMAPQSGATGAESLTCPSRRS
jgi:hypothetical protein